MFASLEGDARTNCTTVTTSLVRSADRRVETLLEHLRRSYQDNDDIRDGFSGLSRPQSTLSFREFLPSFETQLALAGGSTWVDAAKIFALQAVMNPNLKDMLSMQQVGLDDYNAYVQRALHLSQEVARSGGLLARLGGVLETRSHAPQRDLGDMDWEPAGAARAQPPQNRQRRKGPNNNAQAPWNGNPTGHPQGPGLPDDAQLRGRRARWLDRAEFNKRRSEGRCPRCN